MPKIRKTSKKVKESIAIKESELNTAVSSIVDHVKTQVRNVVIEMSNKEVITPLDQKDLETLTNVIDSTIGSAYAQAAQSELKSLYSKIKNSIE